MDRAIRDLAERIGVFPGGRAEGEWLDGFEYLRSVLGVAMATEVHVGRYWIDDFPGHASAGGTARVRGRGAVSGVASDSWEGVLCWSGNRGERGYADAFVFPFLEGSTMQPEGRLADLGPDVEVDRFVGYRFEDGRFVDLGWRREDGPGEWAGIDEPGTLYHWGDLPATPVADTVKAGGPILVDVRIPGLSSLRAKPHAKGGARISLIHVNRNREGTNLVPWTARPPKAGSRYAQGLADCSFPSGDVARIRLDQFKIRGGWIPGRYRLTIRVQNFHKPTDWAWSADISEAVKVEVVEGGRRG